MNSIALYTTYYPEARRFVGDWCSSVISQDCCNFDIWIGVDGAGQAVHEFDILADEFSINFIYARDNDNAVSLRSHAMTIINENYKKIVFVDIDDVLKPSRISAALEKLEQYDVYACTLGIIDEVGRETGYCVGLRDNEDISTVLPKFNVCGLSNTAWRTEILKSCLPVPRTCIAMDWLLATRAWCLDAEIHFDNEIRMLYRQYEDNVARTMPLFRPEHSLRAAEVVSCHYSVILSERNRIPAAKFDALLNAARRVDIFKRNVLASPHRFATYLLALNELPPHHLWWMTVAHPELETIWSI